MARPLRGPENGQNLEDEAERLRPDLVGVSSRPTSMPARRGSWGTKSAVAASMAMGLLDGHGATFADRRRQRRSRG